MSTKAIMSLTDNAVQQVQALLSQRGKPSLGIRIGVKSGGCSGLKYFVEYADVKNPFDEIIETKDVTILIDPKALMYLLGTEMDFVVEEFKSGFTFTNPNEKGKCGCGSSFNV
ncbi:MAG: iron-sulfur cluster assembly accessory protein [Rickettsiaceae bacterium]|nr:iron-sulfur cluster assembly accessory protein [Rickettsiaceae bacterium]MDP4832198.1 iron-sulfur cluster assembly accessory protein [Rickettsiaceae bacterium]MDP5021222.1 iron-sulfur cluster assembly accessory protein [Rickettsiaceae bacterium]MDP5083204.1 iron-sulfur cluster assembly accessory protein [Rickettsiaceae bacterium]